MSGENQLDKKRLILEKALEVFTEKDYQHATVDEIAEKAEIGKGTVYRYFKNKEELYLELLELAAQARREIIQENIRMIEDLRGKLGRFVIALLRFTKNQPQYFKILTAEVGAGNADFSLKVKTVQNEHQEILRQLLTEGVRQNKFREMNPFIASVYLNKLIEGALQIFEREPSLSADQIVLTMLDLIWNGLGKK